MSSDPIGGPLLLQVILIAINAYFASTEIAVLSLNDVKIRRQAEEGDRVAKLLMKLAENPNRFLSTIQVGITLAGFLAAPLPRKTLPACWPGPFWPRASPWIRSCSIPCASLSLR